ncbi:MAG: VRR-NUC domain-containing protein [Acidobacteria bacterium]|nr:VRR-NUC domain-containing protein [Acidobacteriota bacterium]
MTAKNNSGSKPKALSPSESLISKAICDFLDAKKLWHHRVQAGMIQTVKAYKNKKTGESREYRNWAKNARKGTPDRLFLIKGIAHYVEVKKSGRKPTPEQLAVHQEIREAGGVVIIADSIDSFIRQFNELPGRINNAET